VRGQGQFDADIDSLDILNHIPTRSGSTLNGGTQDRNVVDHTNAGFLVVLRPQRNVGQNFDLTIFRQGPDEDGNARKNIARGIGIRSFCQSQVESLGKKEFRG